MLSIHVIFSLIADVKVTDDNALSEVVVTEAVKKIADDYFDTVSKEEDVLFSNNFAEKQHVQAITYVFRKLRVGLNDDMSLFLPAVKKSVSKVNNLFPQGSPYTGEIKVQLNKNIFPMKDIDGKDVLTQEEINVSAQTEPSYVSNVVLQNQFEFYLSFFNEKTFMDNIECIASAYVKYLADEKDPINRANFDGFYDICQRKAPSLSEEVAENAFNKADDFAYTVITLHTLVSEMGAHEKLRVTDFLEKLIYSKMAKAFNGNSDAMAEAFALYVREEVFFMEKEMYRFNGRKSVKVDPYEIARRADIFRPIVETNFAIFKRRQIESKETSREEECEANKIKALKPFLLSSAGNHIEKIARKHLQTNRYVGIDRYGTAYVDGVIIIRDVDGGKKEQIYRRALMEDQIFKHGNAHLYPRRKFSWNDGLVKEIDTCFMQIFGHHREQVQWFYRWMASLHAKDPERCFLILYGKGGGNAKTVLMKALGRMMGDYAFAAGDDMLHSNPGNGHQASIAELEGRNLVYTSEPGMDKPVKCETLKKYGGGGDDVTASKKGQAHRKFELLYKLAWLCNNFPQIDKPDKPLMERMCIMECLGRYVPWCPGDAPLPEHQYPRDDNFWRRDGIIDALLWICIHSWPDYQEKRLVQNDHHKLAIAKWGDGVCTATKFIIEETKDDPKESALYPYELEQVWETYERWMDIKHKEQKKKTKDEFLEIAIKKLKPQKLEVECSDPMQPQVAPKVLTKDIVQLSMKDPFNRGAVRSYCKLIEKKTDTSASMVMPSAQAHFD